MASSTKIISTKSSTTRGLKTSAVTQVGSKISTGKSTKQDRKVSKKTEGPKKFNILEILPVNPDLEQAIDEIQSKGSTSETSEEESQKTDDFDSDIDIQQKLLLALEVLSDEASLSEAEDADKTEETPMMSPIENDLDFFEMLGEMPLIDEISLDLTDDVGQPNDLIKDPGSDSGIFVDPLTGTRLSSIETTKSIISATEKAISAEESKLEEPETEKEKEDEDEDEDEDKLSHEEDMEEPVEEFETKRASQEVAEDTFKLFLETVQEKETQVAMKTEPTEADLKQDKENKSLVGNILQKLIDRCVAKAEYYDSDVILSKSLDKIKLIKELKSKHNLLESEKSISQFLNRKTVSHLKRKGAFGMVSAEKEKTLNAYRSAFHNALSDLDIWLVREEKLKTLYSTEVLDLEGQVQDVKQKSHNEVEKLEELIRGAFHRKNFEKLQNSVEKHLSKMAATRKEISKVRLTLLLQQHQYISLKNQLTQLKDLGAGLTVQDFEAMETETFAMGEQIEGKSIIKKQLKDIDIWKLDGGGT